MNYPFRHTSIQSRPRPSGRCFLPLLAGLCLALVLSAGAVADDTDEAIAAMEQRLSDAVELLAADDMEGRGVGTDGLDKAAAYIAEQFKEIGLKTDVCDDGPFQKFALSSTPQVGKDNTLTLIGPPGEDGQQPKPIELKLTADFMPLAISGAGEFDLPLVFVGYGITAKEKKYDDYEGVDVKGKMVVIFRHEPQQNDAESPFDGTKTTQYAPFAAKVSNAYAQGAAGIIFCTDQVEIQRNVHARMTAWQRSLDKLTAEHAKFKEIEEPTLEQIKAQQQKVEKLLKQTEVLGKALSATYDPVLPFRSARQGDQHEGFPIVHCRREVLDRMINAALGCDLAKLEEQIDDGPKPHSQELTGWRATGKIDVQRNETLVKNVVGVLEGEGPNADETIVIGAHYDHVGFRMLAGEKKEVRNGADDNASGTAAMIEIARTLAARDKKPGRRIVFIAFTAEERGLLGSAHYVNHPLFPIKKTVAMLNMDMVGRLNDNKLIVHGSGTAKGFEGLLDELNGEHGFEMSKKPGGFGASDHSSFYGKRIPVLFLFSGLHEDYHRPTDDFEKINVPGMRRITQMAIEIAERWANADGRPEYVNYSSPSRPRPDGGRPYFGCMPDFAHTDPGLGISGVAGGGPAEKAGLKGGDAIVKFGDSKIDDLDDFDAALRKHKKGDKVATVVRRDGKEITLDVTLGEPK